MKERKILCPDPVEDQAEEALAAVAAVADLEEVAVAASAVEALEAEASEADTIITTIITAPISVGAGALVIIITAVAAALADFSE